MNFEIKISMAGDREITSKASILKYYKIEEIEELIKNRYKQVPKITFDLKVNKKDTIFFIFGTIPPSEYENIKIMEENIFYCSAGFTTLGQLLDRFKFIGFCDEISYTSIFPLFYGRKEVSKRMKNVRLGLPSLNNHDFYIATYSMDKDRMTNFIFDYLEVYLKGVREDSRTQAVAD